jgi:hypothetical protein
MLLWAPGHGFKTMLRASQYSAGYNAAPSTIEPYRGTDHTVAKMAQLVKGPRGEQSAKVRRHTEQIVGNVRPKDYPSEYIAICRWWGNAGRYARDPLHVEMLRDPERMIDDALAGKLVMDCDEVATAIGCGCLVMGGRIQFVTVGFEPPRRGQPKNHSHVFVRAQDPKTKQWWVLDPVAGRKTASMLKRVKQATFFEV